MRKHEGAEVEGSEYRKHGNDEPGAGRGGEFGPEERKRSGNLGLPEDALSIVQKKTSSRI